MSANAAVLALPITTTISAAATAREKVRSFIFCSSNMLGSPQGGGSCARPEGSGAKVLGAMRRSGQASRGMIERWTIESGHKQVVAQDMRRPDWMSQWQAARCRRARLGRFQDTQRN